MAPLTWFFQSASAIMISHSRRLQVSINNLQAPIPTLNRLVEVQNKIVSCLINPGQA